MRRRPVRQCARCGRARPYHGLGICRVCYDTACRVRGTGRPRGSYTEPADWAVVERVLGGEYGLPTNVAERRQVVARLTAAGLSAAEIARLTGLAERSVQRHRAAARCAA